MRKEIAASFILNTWCNYILRHINVIKESTIVLGGGLCSSSAHLIYFKTIRNYRQHITNPMFREKVTKVYSPPSVFVCIS